jgi:UDP-glucose 4-epimerase
MARRPPEVVFHLAAQADVRVSVDDPVLDADINILGSLRVLEGARRAGVSKIVFAASGGTLYGDVRPSDLPARESLPHLPTSPYGVSKMVVVDYLTAYRELHNIEFCALALGNVYGPRQDPHGEAGVVAIFAGLLVAGERCTIFGDGSQTRDFVFVDDVVDAMARAGQRGGGLLINVGTGSETSVLQLYETMASAAGSSQRPVHAPARPGELDRSSLDPGRAAIHLGWKPWTSLAEGTAAVMASTSPEAAGGGGRRRAKEGRGSGQRKRSSR